MTTFSQTPPGALPPEVPVPSVRPLHEAAFATFGLAVPAPAGPAEPAYQSATVTEAAAAVIRERFAEDGGATADELAEAEQRAGILFDPARIEAVESAAREQGYAEASADLEGVRAELQEARTQLAQLAGDHRRLQAVMRLCEGRRGDDLLLVAAIATAAECGTTAVDDFPMNLTWHRTVDVPQAGSRVTLRCTSSYGGRANLTVRGDDRQALAEILGTAEQASDMHATCSTAGCGLDADGLDASDPALFGWACLDVAGTDDPPRWYCTPQCVAAALARASEELAAADQLAAADPDEHVPYLLADDAAPVEVARCVRCGCTEDAACEGGCAWAPNRHMVDLCSRCARPEDLLDDQAAGGDL